MSEIYIESEVHKTPCAKENVQYITNKHRMCIIKRKYKKQNCLKFIFSLKIVHSNIVCLKPIKFYPIFKKIYNDLKKEPRIKKTHHKGIRIQYTKNSDLNINTVIIMYS